MIKKTEQSLAKTSQEMGILLTKSQIDLLMTYARELILWNAKMSLVSLKSPHDITKHLIDSLTPIPLITKGDATLLDIGTGAGLPGIPLKIRVGRLRVTLIESSRKKTSFLKHVIRTLGIRDITAVNTRAESAARETRYRGVFDVVISRATWNIAQLLTIGEPFLSEGGMLIAMKGQCADEELAHAEDTIKQMGLELTGSRELLLPVTGEFRKLFCFRRRVP